MEHVQLESQRINVKGKELNFSLAEILAEDLASGSLSEPMLIAWFDGKKGEEHPQVPECQHKPGWLAYAEGHGGRIRIDVNENEYSFIFADAKALQE
ncbi:MAG: AF1514 family protein [Pseudomonadota bacterium]